MGSFEEDVSTVTKTQTEKLDPTQSVVYRSARMIYEEVMTWEEHPDRYNDNLQELHEAVIEMLELVIDEHLTVAKISFTLPILRREED